MVLPDQVLVNSFEVGHCLLPLLMEQASLELRQVSIAKCYDCFTAAQDLTKLWQKKRMEPAQSAGLAKTHKSKPKGVVMAGEQEREFLEMLGNLSEEGRKLVGQLMTALSQASREEEREAPRADPA